MKKNILIILAFLLVGMERGYLSAKGVGTTGANFLKLEVGARASGMGGAFVGMEEDPIHLWWNPAGIAGLKTQLFATHLEWWEGIGYESLGYIFPFQNLTLGVGINFLHTGKIEKTTYTQPEGTGEDFSMESGTFSLSGALRWRNFTRVGGTLKFIGQRIEKEKGESFALDLGILWEQTPKLKWGLSLLNLGEGLKMMEEEDPLPLTLKIGGSYTNWKRTYLVGWEMDKSLAQEPNFRVGVEVWLGNNFALRSGWRSGPEDTGVGFSFGIGVRSSPLALDYAYVPYRKFTSAHRISLSFRF